MDDDKDRSLILLPVGSLANTAAGAQRILSAMVGEMLSIVNGAAVAHDDLDALVSEGKRLYHQTGDKMTEDNIQAFNLFLRAAVAGHNEAQFRLFLCYKSGYGVQQSTAEAERWLRKAAESGLPKALLILGVAYTSDTMCPTIAKDEEKAIEWFQKAAEKGHYMACIFISDIYKKRNDAAKAFEWMKRGAELGCFDCLYSVFSAYKKGDIVPKDNVESYKWLQLGRDEGYVKEEQITALAELMSPVELESAQRNYREFKANYSRKD